MSAPPDAVLPPGSLILVTAVNGLVASHIADQCLSCGVNVRGTVRDSKKSQWMTEYFDQKYGPGRFKLVEAKDIDKADGLSEAVKGCAGVISTAADTSFAPDPNIVVTHTVQFVRAALEATAKEPSVKRFVLTSSSAAATQNRPNEQHDLTPESWSDWVIELAWAPPPYNPDRIWPVYIAAKHQAERELWKFMKEEKPHFVANAILPDFVSGAPLNVEKQGYPTSAGVIKSLVENRDGWFAPLPQHMIDAGDAGRLHVAALLKHDVQNERIFGYAHPKVYREWIETLKAAYPERTFPDPPAWEPLDLVNVTAKPRAESLLKWLGRDGWRHPVTESMMDVVKTLI